MSQPIIPSGQPNTRQHPQGGGREALSISFRGFFLSSTHNIMCIIDSDCINWRIWTRSPKWTKNGTGISALKSVSGGLFLRLFLICADGDRTEDAGHWLLVGQRNGIGASRKNHTKSLLASRNKKHLTFYSAYFSLIDFCSIYVTLWGMPCYQDFVSTRA